MRWGDHPTADFDGRFEFKEVGLREEDLPGGQAELSDFVLRELDLLAGPAVPKR